MPASLIRRAGRPIRKAFLVLEGTDCGRSFSLGAVLKVTSQGHPDDKVGIGGGVDALSPAARAYLAAGGLAS